MPFKRINSKSIRLDGTDDRIVIPISADRLKLSFVEGTDAEIAAGTAKDKPFSIAAWIFVQDVTTGRAAGNSIGDGSILSVLDQDTGTSKHEYLFTRTNATNLLLWLYDTRDHLGRRLMVKTTSNPLQSATWHFIVATYDGSGHQNGINFYVDGVLQAVNRAQTGNPYTHMQPKPALRPAIGGYPIERGDFEDFMADVCVFDKELTLAEVKEVYNGGKVKDMTKASTYNNLLSWWKMGDDQDTTGALGIKDYISRNHGTLTNGAYITASPELGTDLVKIADHHIYTSHGRTRQINNAAGAFETAISTSTAAPSLATDGYATENQRYMHLAVNGFPGATDNNSAFTIWGYSYAMGRWGRLTRHGSGFQNIWINGDGNQHQLQHSQDSPQCTKYVLEIAGIDRIYVQHGGAFDATNDKVYLGFNTF